MTDLADWIRSLGASSPAPDGAELATDSEAPTEDEPESSLYQCSECRSVYVAAQKTTCAGCGTPVERITSKLPASE